jgi:two-component system phosphate regulon response regulator PhoB
MARILIADDAGMLRTLASRSLGDHKTIQAADGTEALALVKEHRPDIVILDWMMPGLTGIEVSRAIREDPKLAGTQIIMMTARTGFDSEAQAREAGVNHFISKPIMPRQLSNLVEQIVADRREQRRP